MNLEDNDFALFGLSERFALDRGELDERWRALQAQVHPDRFVDRGAAAQATATRKRVAGSRLAGVPAGMRPIGRGRGGCERRRAGRPARENGSANRRTPRELRGREP